MINFIFWSRKLILFGDEDETCIQRQYELISGDRYGCRYINMANIDVVHHIRCYGSLTCCISAGADSARVP